MKILLKILVAPVALALSLLAALLVFLFDICTVLLTIASVILAADDFKKYWLLDDVNDDWSDYFMFAIWEKDEDEIKIRFE